MSENIIFIIRARTQVRASTSRNENRNDERRVYYRRYGYLNLDYIEIMRLKQLFAYTAPSGYLCDMPGER